MTNAHKYIESPLENKIDKYEPDRKQLCSYNIIGAFSTKGILYPAGQKLREKNPSRKNGFSNNIRYLYVKHFSCILSPSTHNYLIGD